VENQIKDHSLKNKMMDQEIEKRIWDYIDGICNSAEKALIKQKLEDDPLWRVKYTELTGIQDLLRQEDLEMPSLRFTKNVMEEIAKYQVAPATKNYINKNVIRGITGFFLTMIGGLVVYFLGQIHWANNSTSHLLPYSTLGADRLNWSKLLSNTYVNIFIGINVILGLILLDKYMQGKKKNGNTHGLSEGDTA
jgi:hypothetical protein